MRKIFEMGFILKSWEIIRGNLRYEIGESRGVGLWDM